MARKPAPKPDTQDPIGADLLAADADRITREGETLLAASDEDRIAAERISSLINALDADIPDDEDALLRGGIQGLNLSVATLARTGLYFLKLKETHWRRCFVQKLAEHDIPQRHVYNAMSVATMLLKLPKKVCSQIANFSGTHLIELAKIPYETLEEAAETGVLAGQPLDDISRMSVRELKEAVKKARADNDVKDQLLAEKNLQLDETAIENERLRSGARPGEPSLLAQQAKAATEGCMVHLATMMSIINQLDDGDRPTIAAMHAGIEECRAMFAAVREEHLVRFQDFHMAIDDASTPAYHGQAN